MKKLAKIAAVLVLAAPFTASAAEPLPKPIEGMECLVGKWKGQGTVTMGGQTSKVDVAWNCARTSARHGVSCTLRMKGIPGMPVYEETDLFGFEPGTNTYHWFSVTNAGETHDHVSPAVDSDKLQFVHSGTQETKPFKEVIDMQFAKGGKSLALRAETFLAGTSTSVFQVEAQK